MWHFFVLSCLTSKHQSSHSSINSCIPLVPQIIKLNTSIDTKIIADKFSTSNNSVAKNKDNKLQDQHKLLNNHNNNKLDHNPIILSRPILVQKQKSIINQTILKEYTYIKAPQKLIKENNNKDINNHIIKENIISNNDNIEAISSNIYNNNITTNKKITFNNTSSENNNNIITEVKKNTNSYQKLEQIDLKSSEEQIGDKLSNKILPTIDNISQDNKTESCIDIILTNKVDDSITDDTISHNDKSSSNLSDINYNNTNNNTFDELNHQLRQAYLSQLEINTSNNNTIKLSKKQEKTDKHTQKLIELLQTDQLKKEDLSSINLHKINLLQLLSAFNGDYHDIEHRLSRLSII